MCLIKMEIEAQSATSPDEGAHRLTYIDAVHHDYWTVLVDA